MNEVEEIKNRLDIVEVIGGYVPLKPAGRNFKALSPFHQEKTPSFMVSPEKNIWHDFSSGQGGDVFSFVMQIEGIDFRDALELLARRAGVSLQPNKRTSRAAGSQKASLYVAMERAVAFYHQQLSRDKKALAYLKAERGLKPSTIKTFLLGYAPDSWEALSDYLKRAKISSEIAKQAGLVGQKSGRSNTFDMFRGRIMFPIFDSQGRAIGFSARLLGSQKDAPKYINTPETPIYHKSTAIYGLSAAKEAIRQSEEVIVVEGNMDVVSVYQAGQKNVVAISGTALTIEQLKILSRLAKNIKLCFDSDEAGIKATLRSIELAATQSLNLSVIELAQAKDPDEMIKKNKSDWESAVKNSVYGLDFVFTRASAQSDIRTGPGKRHYAGFVLPFINQLSDSIEQDHYIKKLAQTLDVDEISIRQKINQPIRQPSTKTHTDKDETNNNSIQHNLTKIERIELTMLELFLPYPTTRVAMSELNLDEISQRFAPYFLELSKNPKASLDKLAKNLRQLENTTKIIALRGENEYSALGDNDLRLEAYTQVHRWQKSKREAKLHQLTRKIALAEESGDVANAEKYLAEYQSLLSEES